MAIERFAAVQPRSAIVSASQVTVASRNDDLFVHTEPPPVSDILLNRALDWISSRLEEFDPLGNPDTFDVTRGQRLGELAILARTVAAMAERSDDPRIRQMVDLLERSQASAVYRDRVVRAPIEFMLFVETYATLRSLGSDDELFRARLQKAIQAGWLNQTERFPHRAMDIRSCLDACGIESDLPPLDELYRRSILGALPSPILLNEHDLYALTHVVMFVCDFGRRSPDIMPRAHVTPVSDLLSALVVVATRDTRWDLLAEFLLCWSCMELPETGLIEKGWEALARAQRPDGAVPGPEYHGGPLLFEHTYHTTLVCALAASIRQHKTRSTQAVAESFDDPADFIAQEPLTKVSERAAAWLAQVLEGELLKEPSSALRLSQVLVGLWCCSALTDAVPPALLSRIVHRLSNVASTPEWQSLPPLLKTVSAAWSAAHCAAVPAMHGEGGFLQLASDTFHRAASGTEEDCVLEMSEMWAAIHQLELAPAPRAFSHAELQSRSTTFPLDANAGQLEGLLRLIEASTAGGTREAQWTGDAAWIPELVAGLALDACRRYDLVKASDLLRIGVSIAAEDTRARRILRVCAKYLVFNQREDGAFGFLGPELANRLRALGPGANETDCLLPQTVGCLLALAEFSGDWGLLTELRTLAPAVQATLAFKCRNRRPDVPGSDDC